MIVPPGVHKTHVQTQSSIFTADCIFGGRPTPTDARALSTQEIQENQKIQPLPRYSYGGFETAHVDTSEPSRCTYVFRIVISSHIAELRKPGHPPMLGAFDRVLGHSCPLLHAQVCTGRPGYLVGSYLPGRPWVSNRYFAPGA